MTGVPAGETDEEDKGGAGGVDKQRREDSSKNLQAVDLKGGFL
jgi:hypothetical protein